ncbi:hypothetical protein AMJ86_03285 [bacterium SM23_57]|nr:MAG: hypothetical protein AMJ86_03285 [bacterium SM23_57]
MIRPSDLNISLTQEQEEVLTGSKGKTIQKIMETIVLYGEALNADRLVDLEGAGHFVIPWCNPGISPPIEMLEELVEAGLKTKFPFTLDPRPPLDFENLKLGIEIEERILEMFDQQDKYDKLMMQLGLRDSEAYTCNPCQPQVGNIPERDMAVAWSESACVIYANSVLGARTNRNGAIMDLLLNIVGIAPLAGLLTDEGRRADWHIEIKIEEPPNPQILGTTIGKKILAGVPYITGLHRTFSGRTEDWILDYLREMSAVIATYSAVDLFHVENITPEAVDFGRKLIGEGYQTYCIDEEELDSVLNSFPILWDDRKAKPEMAYIGCPHLSLRQLNWWAEKINEKLDEHGKERLEVATFLFAPPKVLDQFKESEDLYKKLLIVGVCFSPTCCETIFESGLLSGKPIVTNSVKLQAYTSARYLPDESLLDVLISGEIGDS